MSKTVKPARVKSSVSKKKEKPVPVPPPPPPPPPTTKYIQGSRIEIKGKINFKTNSAEILPSAYPILDDAIQTMKEHPEISLLEIQGYTDSTGPDDYNMKLSQRRADSVKSYFVSKGINSNRLATKGYGESNPIASNDTREGRAKNRRIVFEVKNYKQ